jgi:hypothetical protein
MVPEGVGGMGWDVMELFCSCWGEDGVVTGGGGWDGTTGD